MRIDDKLQTITKPVPAVRFEMELAMSREAHRISALQHRFTVPQIIRSNPEEGTISLEYYPNLRSIRSFLDDSEIMPRLVRMAAESLAYVHANLSPEKKIGLPPELDLPERPETGVFLHGDYTIENVQVDNALEKLVILDWSLTPLVNCAANWGTFYWDLGWMVKSILVMPPFRCFRNREREGLADIFIQNYMRASGHKLEPAIFGPYLQRIHRIFSAKARKYLGWRYLRQWRNYENMRRYSVRLGLR